MDESELRRLALLGARARLVEIDAERDRLLEAFPELGKRRGPGGNSTASETRVLYTAPRGKRSRVKFTDEEKAAAIAQYREGVPAATIIAGLRSDGSTRNTSMIYRWLREASNADVPPPPPKVRGAAAQRLPWKEETLAAMGTAPISCEELAGKLDMRKDSTYYRLRQLRDKGLVKGGPDKKFVVTAKGTAALEAASRDA